MSEKGPQYSLPTEEDKARIKDAHDKWENGEITSKEYGNIIADITGALPKGENPKVDVTLPEKVGERYVHRFDRTFLESGHAPEEVSEGIAKDILEGARTFERISNKSLVARAENRINLTYCKFCENIVELR
jgi:hypothetical protein